MAQTRERGAAENATASAAESVREDMGAEARDSQNDVLAQRSAILEDSRNAVDAGSLRSQQLWEERESRNALKRVADLRGPIARDSATVEYQQVRLERVVLVGVWSAAETTAAAAEESIRELAALAQTAGADVVAGFLQQRPHPDPATYLGSGKAKELARIVDAEGADTIIANTELPPSQRRALEDLTGVRVIDRTAVILDIFAQHATSSEGKAQVELAQLQYMLPRLRGWGASLSRQAGGQAAGQMGGIGSRGPGETRLEMDRRRIHKRISKLRHDIAAMKPVRDTKRGSRHRAQMPLVAVVGYTNAGKSSLANRLTGSQELVRNALFATLDTAVRRATTPTGRAYAYADTVGFVRNLPTQLVEAFKSTLEEAQDADVILHVVDCSGMNPQAQIDAVNAILGDLPGVEDLPVVLAFNKADLLNQTARTRLTNLYPQAVFCSAATGEGIADLRAAVEAALPRPNAHVEAVIGFGDAALIEQARRTGVVESATYGYDGIHVDAWTDDGLAARLLAASERAGRGSASE